MKCYLCGSMSFKKRGGTVRDVPAIPILECLNCSLVFLGSRDHLGPAHYENSGMFGEKLPSISEVLARACEDDSRRFDSLFPLILDKKVLDFGSGCGGFLQKIKPYAKFSMGLELEDRVHDYWGDKLLLRRDIRDAHYFEPFDLITAFHVIEHLMDPRTTLTALSDLLSDEGQMVIEVPNAADALLSLYESSDFQNFTYWSQHLYLFNSSTLKTVLEQAGLTVTAIKQHQRYPLSNHLYWLSKGRPGGHGSWWFLNDLILNQAYASALAAIGSCDTLIAYVKKSQK